MASATDIGAARAELQEVDTEAAVAAEQRAGNVVRVAASSIEVEDELPTYASTVKRETKHAFPFAESASASDVIKGIVEMLTMLITPSDTAPPQRVGGCST